MIYFSNRMRYVKLFIVICFFPTGAFAQVRDSVQMSSIKNVIDGPFAYPAYHSKLGYYVAQQRTGSYLQLFRINEDKTTIQLTADSANHSHASISANGNLLAYTKELNGKSDIFILNLLNSQHVNLTNTPEFSEAHPSWASNDGVVCFNSNQFDTLQEICSITLADKKIRRITVNHEEDTYGSISPDGTKLVYTKWLEDQKNPEIYVKALAGGTETRLTHFSGRDVAPVWFSDSVIAYSQQGITILHNLRTGLQKKLVSGTSYLFARGVAIGRASFLCERLKDRRPDGVAIITFPEAW